VPDELSEQLRDPPADLQRAIALRAAEIVAPYGELDSSVIEPSNFRRLASALGTKADMASTGVRSECRSVIDRFDEEPDGNGFFVLGAVVAMFYAAQAVEDPAVGVVNASARLRDIAGFADDDGLAGAYELAVRWLRTRSDADAQALSELIASDARRRSE